jgi:short chain dehydrogenase
VSSDAGKVGFEDISVYCASKFGIIGLTESRAWEVGNYNIRVMTVCPREVATKMQKDVDPQYYGLNKHKMLHPKTVAEKITTFQLLVFSSNSLRYSTLAHNIVGPLLQKLFFIIFGLDHAFMVLVLVLVLGQSMPSKLALPLLSSGSKYLTQLLSEDQLHRRDWSLQMRQTRACLLTKTQ